MAVWRFSTSMPCGPISRNTKTVWISCLGSIGVRTSGSTLACGRSSALRLSTTTPLWGTTVACKPNARTHGELLSMTTRMSGPTWIAGTAQFVPNASRTMATFVVSALGTPPTRATPAGLVKTRNQALESGALHLQKIAIHVARKPHGAVLAKMAGTRWPRKHVERPNCFLHSLMES